MFEKEAKERAEKLEENQTLGVYDNDEDLTRDEEFNDGEVYGYEKGFQDGAEFGYNKANEWHYVEDELPEEDDVYLIYTTKGVLLGHYEQGGADGETNFKGEPYSDFTEYPSEMLFTEDDVIAWCEIPQFKE